MDSPTRRPSARLFSRPSLPDARFVAEILRAETVGGALLLGAAVIGLVWANSPWEAAYESLRGWTVGPAAIHLDLPLEVWAADGLLAIFFFVAGLELKRELVVGELHDPRRALVPIAAAVGGVVVPALVFLAIAGSAGGGAAQGWAIPTATDIAFALAVLAVVSSHLPAALRTFLLTLAVVDDLIAIMIIAVVYTDDLKVVPLLLALLPLGAFALAVQRHVHAWWLLLPLGLLTWVLVHESGVHATVAGVLLGFAVPARGPHDREHGPAEHFEHLWRPISAGGAVPVFALLAAGVNVGGLAGLRDTASSPVALGIVAGLVLGKSCGVFVATYLVARFTRADLDPDLSWRDVAGLSILGGVGFTVSLLIGELAFGPGSELDAEAKIGVLAGSILAAIIAAILLRSRNRHYAELASAS